MNPDRILLERIYTPLSRAAGRRFGSTACSLSRSCIAPMVVFSFIRIFENRALTPSTMFFSSVCLLTLAAMFWLRAGLADHVPNPLALEPSAFRLIWLVLTAPAFILFSVELYKIGRVLEAACTVSVIYFRAVPAPPPMRRRSTVRSAPLKVGAA